MLNLKRQSKVLSTVLLMLALGNCASDRYPIPEGHAESYWEHACGVELPDLERRHEYAQWDGVFPRIGNWYFYYFQERRGRYVYRVSHNVLVDHVPQVYAHLRRGPQWPPATTRRDREFVQKSERFAECLDISIQAGGDHSLFLERVNATSASPSRRVDEQEEIESFLAQWRKARLYWATVLFEGVVLLAWWMFTFHRGVYGRLNKRLDVRIAFSPILLLAPHYLGYSPYLFTFGLSGGILYPAFVGVVYSAFGGIPINATDIWLFEELPQPLRHISQIPAAPLTISRWTAISPTALLVFAGVVLVIARLLRQYKRMLCRLTTHSQATANANAEETPP